MERAPFMSSWLERCDRDADQGLLDCCARARRLRRGAVTGRGSSTGQPRRPSVDLTISTAVAFLSAASQPYPYHSPMSSSRAVPLDRLRPQLAAFAAGYGRHRPAIQKVLTGSLLAWVLGHTAKSVVFPSSKARDTAAAGGKQPKGRRARAGKGPRVEVSPSACSLAAATSPGRAIAQ
jgi:hypothetical protein